MWLGSVLGSSQKHCWGVHREGHSGPAQPAAAAWAEKSKVCGNGLLDPSQLEGAGRVGGEGQRALRKMVRTKH